MTAVPRYLGLELGGRRRVTSAEIDELFRRFDAAFAETGEELSRQKAS